MTRPAARRIVSLLPATTDALVALGCEEQLVGVSHECDAPGYITQLPACTEPKFTPFGTSRQIDDRVKELLSEGLSVYRVNSDLLAELKPDLIITQDHCEVCAASLDEVTRAVENAVGPDCRVLSLSPGTLSEVWESIYEIGEAVGEETRAGALLGSIRDRMEQLSTIVADRSEQTVATIEWIDPLMTAGNWTPELVEIAGGKDLLAAPGSHSGQISFSQLLEADPDVIVVIPCGYPLETTRAEMATLASNPEWNRLKAVKNGRVALADGNKYFNRSGPMLADSAEIVAEVLHPDLFPGTYFRSNAWEWWTPIKSSPDSPE